MDLDRQVPGVPQRAVCPGDQELTLAEEHLHDHLPGYPVMPASLIIEGLAQTGGILVGEAGGFAEKVVLAKIPRRRVFRRGLRRRSTDLRGDAHRPALRRGGRRRQGVSRRRGCWPTSRSCSLISTIHVRTRSSGRRILSSPSSFWACWTWRRPRSGPASRSAARTAHGRPACRQRPGSRTAAGSAVRAVGLPGSGNRFVGKSSWSPDAASSSNGSWLPDPPRRDRVQANGSLPHARFRTPRGHYRSGPGHAPGRLVPDPLWAALAEGHGAVRPIEAFRPRPVCPTDVVAEIRGFDFPRVRVCPKHRKTLTKSLKYMARDIQLAVAAAELAMPTPGWPMEGSTQPGSASTWGGPDLHRAGRAGAGDQPGQPPRRLVRLRRLGQGRHRHDPADLAAQVPAEHAGLSHLDPERLPGAEQLDHRGRGRRQHGDRRGRPGSSPAAGPT